jgi:glutamine amidotransferase
MTGPIGLVDYGMGNLHSVQRAFERLGVDVRAVRGPEAIDVCQALVLPGVGAFDPAMERLEATGWVAPLRQWQQQGKPLLGICLGLQLLFESSAEGQRPGLGLFKGRVEALPCEPDEQCPHMGWAPLLAASPSPLLLAGAPAPWMYFVHSFAAVPSDPGCITARAPYGRSSVVAAVGSGALQATQFHPEKSGQEGLALLGRWLRHLP